MAWYNITLQKTKTYKNNDLYVKNHGKKLFIKNYIFFRLFYIQMENLLIE